MATLTWKTKLVRPDTLEPGQRAGVDLDWVGGRAPFRLEIDPADGSPKIITNPFVSEAKGISIKYDKKGSFPLQVKLDSADNQKIEFITQVRVGAAPVSPQPAGPATGDIAISAKIADVKDDRFSIRGTWVNKSKVDMPAVDLYVEVREKGSQVTVLSEVMDTDHLRPGKDSTILEVIRGLRPDTDYQVTLIAFLPKFGKQLSDAYRLSARTSVTEEVPLPPPKVAPLIEEVKLPEPKVIQEAPAGLAEFLIKGGYQGALARGEDPLTPIKAEAEKFFGFIGDEVSKIFREQILSQLTRGPIEIGNALNNATTVAIKAMTAGVALYGVSTATDLLHPLKGTGIVPMAIDLNRALGREVLTDNIIGSYANVAIQSPLTKLFNSEVRPYRPAGSTADQMFFEGHIEIEEWKGLYRYQGWPEEYIDKWQKTMYIEPSDRLLLTMFEDALVPEEWIMRKLIERGYGDDDIIVITGYARRKALERTREGSKSTVIKRYTEGYIDDAGLAMELRQLRFNDDEITQILEDAGLRRDTERREDLIAFAKRAFQTDVMSLDDFVATIEDTIRDKKQSASIIGIEVFKKTGKPPKKK